MRKVFLDDLPKRGRFIDWKNSIGYKIPFVYDDIEGEVEIVEYIGNNIWIKYSDNEPYGINTNSFKTCKLGVMLGKKTKDFKIEIGTPFKDDKRDLIITDREYRRRKNGKPTINEKYYKYTCNKCGWTEGWMVEGNLRKGKGCSCCYNRTAVLGINTIYDTNPWMIKLGVSENDAKKYTKSSGKKIEVTCPDCGHKKNMSINTIYQQKSISCSCGDGVSYPEKFMTNILMQLGVEFETQLSKNTFEWCADKRYDFYIPSLNMIIETHGEQHYKEQSKQSKFKSLKEEQGNDKLKKELALANGVEYYLVIDCRYSELEWIKNNILNSELANMFDLSNIDWLKCEEFALSNLVKEVCDYWNNKEEWESTYTIANNNPWGIKSCVTIISYLKKGIRHNWCEYNAKFECLKSSRKLNKTGKPIKIFKDGISLGVFESAVELVSVSEELFGVKLSRGHISQVCNEKRKTHKGFTFQYR